MQEYIYWNCSWRIESFGICWVSRDVWIVPMVRAVRKTVEFFPRKSVRSLPPILLMNKSSMGFERNMRFVMNWHNVINANGTNDYTNCTGKIGNWRVWTTFYLINFPRTKLNKVTRTKPLHHKISRFHYDPTPAILRIMSTSPFEIATVIVYMTNISTESDSLENNEFTHTDLKMWMMLFWNTKTKFRMKYLLLWLRKVQQDIIFPILPTVIS